MYAAGALPLAQGSVSCAAGTNVRYVCPQRIDLCGEDREVTLYFRVAAPQAKVRLSAVQEGRELRGKKQIKVNPGEMEHLTVKSGDIKPGNLTVSIAKEA